MKLESKSRLQVCLAVTIAALTLLAAGVTPAAAQYFGDQCNDDAVRAEFAQEVAAGATEADLEAKYGGCREYVDPTNECTSEPAALVEGLRVESAALLTPIPYPYPYPYNNNTFYERLGRTACGYHPQAEMASCAIELRRRTGYGAFGAHPLGSTEWVRFCLDCNHDGFWDYTTVGFVHVTNDISGGPLPFMFESHATTWDAPSICWVNNGGWGRMRSILSWNLKPATCSSRPFWGNTIDVNIRRDP